MQHGILSHADCLCLTCIIPLGSQPLQTGRGKPERPAAYGIGEPLGCP
jgi:hypothetical protein